MQRTRLAAALSTTLSAAFIPTAHAASLPPAEYTLEEIVVTATRTAQTVDETLAPVTILTRAQIERSQSRSLVDILQGLSGVEIANDGGAGKTTSVYMRGTNNGHALVLIDGVKVGSATLGQVAFQDIPLAQIERIEIVRGPRSSLYGSEAIGGVIQIFTRKGRGVPLPSLRLTRGSYDTWQVGSAVSGGTDRLWYSLGVDSSSTDGFSAQNGSETDDDGYRNVSGHARVGYRINADTEMELTWLRARGDNEFDGSSQNQADAVQQVVGASLRLKPSANWQSTLRWGQAWDQSDNFLNGVFRSRFTTRRETLSWQNDWHLAGGDLLTLGADYQDDRVGGTTNYAIKSRANQAVFAQYQWRMGKNDWLASLRHDDNEQFGSHVTGGLTWGRALTPELRLTAAYGSAFKAPTFNALYYPGSGNPGLKPEESESAEIGLSGKVGGMGWLLRAFENRVDNMIQWAKLNGVWTPLNMDARIRGLESELSGRWLDWDMKTALTLQAPENRPLDPNQPRWDAPRRAEKHLRLDADRKMGAFQWGATLLAQGRRYDDVANSDKLSGYATLDLRAEYALDKDWRLQGKLVNLFDRDYETARGYNQPGRSVFLTLLYQPR